MPKIVFLDPRFINNEIELKDLNINNSRGLTFVQNAFSTKNFWDLYATDNFHFKALAAYFFMTNK